MLFFYLNHSFNVRGQPTKRSNARGAPQLAQRSMKSQTGSPTNGLKSAVQNPQKAIHKSAMRIGFIRTKIASAISDRPIKNKSCVANFGSLPPKLANQPT